VRRENESLEQVNDVLDVVIGVVGGEDAFGGHVLAECPADVEFTPFHDRLRPVVPILTHGRNFEIDDNEIGSLVADLLENGEELFVAVGTLVGEKSIHTRICNAVGRLGVYDVELKK
jgi:hypothetical protein